MACKYYVDDCNSAGRLWNPFILVEKLMKGTESDLLLYIS